MAVKLAVLLLVIACAWAQEDQTDGQTQNPKSVPQNPQIPPQQGLAGHHHQRTGGHGGDGHNHDKGHAHNHDENVHQHKHGHAAGSDHDHKHHLNIQRQNPDLSAHHHETEPGHDANGHNHWADHPHAHDGVIHIHKHTHGIGSDHDHGHHEGKKPEHHHEMAPGHIADGHDHNGNHTHNHDGRDHQHAHTHGRFSDHNHEHHPNLSPEAKARFPNEYGIAIPDLSTLPRLTRKPTVTPTPKPETRKNPTFAAEKAALPAELPDTISPLLRQTLKPKSTGAEITKTPTVVPETKQAKTTETRRGVPKTPPTTRKTKTTQAPVPTIQVQRTVIEFVPPKAVPPTHHHGVESSGHEDGHLHENDHPHEHDGKLHGHGHNHDEGTNHKHGHHYKTTTKPSGAQRQGGSGNTRKTPTTAPDPRPRPGPGHHHEMAAGHGTDGHRHKDSHIHYHEDGISHGHGHKHGLESESDHNHGHHSEAKTGPGVGSKTSETGLATKIGIGLATDVEANVETRDESEPRFETRGSLRRRDPGSAMRKSAEYITNSINSTIDPCSNFYEFACGGWIARANPPHDKIYTAFDDVKKRSSSFFMEILGQLSDDNLVKIYYDKCMEGDKSANTEEFIKLMRKVVNTITKYEKPEDTLAVLLGLTGRLTGFGILLSPEKLTAGQRYHLNFQQPQLALSPNRYLPEPAHQTVQKKYKALLRGMAKAAIKNAPFDLNIDPKAVAERVFKFDADLAGSLAPPSQTRDPHFTYNVMPLKDIANNYTFVNWDLWLQTLLPPEIYAQFSGDTLVNIQSIPFVDALNQILLDTEPLIAHLYIFSQLALRSVKNFHIFMPPIQDLLDEIAGVNREITASEACTKETIQKLGKHLVGKLFVDNMNSQKSEALLDDMILSLKGSMESSLLNSAWIDEQTRAAALKKLDRMVINTLFPEFYNDPVRFSDYHRGLNFSRNDTSFEIARRVSAWRPIADYYRDLFLPVDQVNDWFIGPTPRWVTAYNNLEANSILFPMGILQPPFFDPDQPMAINFGAMGSVIGHEITHAFDDIGKNYDEIGRIKEWISDQSLDRFDKRAGCFKEQYREFRVPVFPEIVPNVNNTIGEDIADNGGVRIAFEAFQRHRAGSPEMYGNVTGLDFSPEQLFFLGWSQFHCSIIPDDQVERRLRMHGRSFPKFRLEGPLMNFEKFSEAFSCGLGARMNPVDKCMLWSGS